MMGPDQTTISGGLYLVLDPSVEEHILLPKLEAALKGGLQVVQVWNNWRADVDKLKLISAIGSRCKMSGVPLLVNGDWTLLLQTPALDGVHFDVIVPELDAVRASVGRPFLTGVTCSGDLDTVVWAKAHQLDYVSFCAMFPSPSAGTCDIVLPETVRKAREMTDMPLFVSGGITPENIVDLSRQISFDGVAVISGLLSAEDPEQKVQDYHQALYL